MAYVDGFLLALPKKNVQLYRRISQKAGKIWRSHGALEYRECVGDDIKPKKGMGMPFARTVRLKPGETVVFSWIVYRSRAQRDSVNAKVMKDPRMTKMMEEGPMPFDVKRMAYGGFKVIVDL
jgi:uncharacterized protein YbaA (DUF1428 family)